ncbi:hypothetical protein AX769_04515 [Frondihabitans sp. PAMC 28766]|uniref:MFS transporter n=1 Tax=Frondihabitans sp. PAMC 28766 TaxID=1795630 RepID=UPI00078D49AC|nr:MFS transporter [Frondihabitans sp. PAMC 28766]AMM19537.1 hypothetical protein AX769_04515 [Frondihabitans sp. PAMC 28766]
MVIRRDFSPERAGFITGIYTSALNVGSMITSLATAPLAAATGWPLALIAWAGFAVIAGIVWVLTVGVRGDGNPSLSPARTRRSCPASAATRR